MVFLKTLSLAALLCASASHTELPDLAIGDGIPAADVKVKDITGNDTDLRSIAGPNGLLVMLDQTPGQPSTRFRRQSRLVCSSWFSCLFVLIEKTGPQLISDQHELE